MSDFERVKKSNPCLICGSATWCWRVPGTDVSGCMRAVSGGVERTSNDGSPYRLFGEVNSHVTFRDRTPGVEVASVDVRNAIYLRVLDQLSLSDPHTQNLGARGLDSQESEYAGYKTWVGRNRFDVVKHCQTFVDDETLLMVPGFVQKVSDSGRTYIDFVVPEGMIIPILNVDGHVEALKVRLDDGLADTLGCRYTSVSSDKTYWRGPTAGVHVHHPPAMKAIMQETCHVLRVTEGELKAHSAWRLDGTPTIGMPGVGQWRLAVDAAVALNPSVIVVAYDADAETNLHVKASRMNIVNTLRKRGLIVHVETWDGDAKGVDDRLLVGETSWSVFAAEAVRVRDAVLSGERFEVCHVDGACAVLWGKLNRVLGAGSSFSDQEKARLFREYVSKRLG